MKTCTKCGETKLEDQFSKASKRRDGLQPWCKQCRKAIAAAWYQKNQDKQKAYSVAYRSANSCKERAASWYEKNKDRVREKSRLYMEANKARVALYGASYRITHKDQRATNARNRRARMLSAGGNLSHGLSARLFALQKGKCACGCKQPLGDDYHLDHIMPLALGGSNTDSNIQLLRRKCNLQKHAKHPADFMRERGYLI